jgi:xanthine dehydrogenase YagT iron-sulfur-binding subunit
VNQSEPTAFEITRRETLQVGAAAGAVSLIPEARANPPSVTPVSTTENGPTVPISARINGSSVLLQIDARASLLDMLRERLGLTGAKKGCDHGQCGACTVHLDGHRITSCLTMAAKVDGREIVTIEGIAEGDTLHPMQQAFIDHDALQCGYCTPGQIMAAIACVKEGHATTRDQIREYMSGNICRCGAYVGIVAAIEDAAAKMRRA